ncbi:hypothetical protein MUP01_03875, partial [Candidatus Bathyarchaeota archaeon]|nr:hypothetical protein [Candidatus Bathyarchaeota archaeon]
SWDLYVMNADGSGQTQITFTGTGVENRGPAFSPDSRRIAFASDRTGNHEIYVMNADGSGVTQLTFSNSYNGEPAWSPDGSKIAFSSTRDGNWEIYVMDIDGSHVTRLTFNNLYDSRAPDWQRLFTAGAGALAVGGVTLPTNKREILTPYLTIAGLVAAVSAVVVVKRRTKARALQPSPQ